MQVFWQKNITALTTKSVSEIYYLGNDKFDKIGQIFAVKAIKFQSKFKFGKTLNLYKNR